MQRTTTCVDCGAEFTYGHRPSSPRVRCEGCRAKRTREMDRARLVRWRSENRERIVRLPDELWDEAEEVAADRGESLTDVIRRALEAYVSGR